MGGLKKYLENGKSWGVGGSYVKFPPWWGYGYFLELHDAKTLYHDINFNNLRNVVGNNLGTACEIAV